MIEIISIILFILAILTLVMFLLINKVVKTVNNQSKVFFALKLQDYDNLIEEKSKKLESIRDEEQKYEAIKPISNDNKQEQKNDNLIMPFNNPEYQIEGIFEEMKQIDESFKLDHEKIIHDFIKENVDHKTDHIYKELLMLKETINNKGVYNILNSIDDLYFLQHCSKETKDILEGYIEDNEYIVIDELLTYIDIEIEKNNPTIYVQVGSKTLNYDNESLNIKTVYNEKIFKGIKINYKNKLYDYSLS